MPVLENTRHESYAQARATGMGVAKAAHANGFSKRSYYNVENRPDVQARILELRDEPVGRAELIRMYRVLHDKAVLSGNLTVASQSLASIAFISGHGPDPRKPQRMAPVRRGGAPKPTKEKRAHQARTPPPEELEEEYADGTEPTHAGGERDISDIHKALDGLNTDAGARS